MAVNIEYFLNQKYDRYELQEALRTEELYNDINNIYLKNLFASQYQINFYKMSFSNMKETELKEYIKYYPSLVIYNNGEFNSHSAYYNSINGFTKWFSNYVSIKKSNTNNNIIGNKSFVGFSKKYEEEFLKAIKDQHLDKLSESTIFTF